MVDKPWAMIDEDGEIQKLIFKRDKGLILSKNGKVTLGSWDYFPESKSLYIDRSVDKLLLNEQFIDENVLILKKDGTDNQLYALANENTIPDYNVAGYLETLRFEKLKITEVALYTGEIIQIHNTDKKSPLQIANHAVETFDANKEPAKLPDGIYVSQCKKFTYIIQNGRIQRVATNYSLKSNEGITYEIADGELNIENNLGNIITLNGRLIDSKKIYTNLENPLGYGYAIMIDSSHISRITFTKKITLKEGYTVIIEQQSAHKISKGDKIIFSEPISPLPDGKYRISDWWGTNVWESWWGTLRVKDLTVI